MDNIDSNLILNLINNMYLQGLAYEAVPVSTVNGLKTYNFEFEYDPYVYDAFVNKVYNSIVHVLHRIYF